MLIEVKIKGIALDPLSNMPIVFLKDVASNQTLPIWIGFFEANAIISQIENIIPSRPMTHDLIAHILDGLNAKIERAVITELKENTFYAVIELIINGNKIQVDSRPSDAIAIALRGQAPFFVEEEVFNNSKKLDLDDTADLEDKWKDWLERANPDDFGKYPM